MIKRVKGPKRIGYDTRPLSAIKRIVIHHGATRRGLGGTNYLSYLNFHVDGHGWSIGGYTFGVEDNGEILQGYELTDQTNHVGTHNPTSLGIVLPGDFRYEEPTAAQWASLYWLLDYLKGILPNVVEIVGHQELPGYGWKPCPSLDMNQIRRNAAAPKKEIVVRLTKPTTITNEGVKTMILKDGSKGPDVKTLQEQLEDLGYNVGPIDGRYGPKTTAAVKAFQKAQGISVDGIAGPNTFAKLKAAIKGTSQEAAKKESTTFILGGRKYRVEEV